MDAKELQETDSPRQKIRRSNRPAFPPAEPVPPVLPDEFLPPEPVPLRSGSPVSDPPVPDPPGTEPESVLSSDDLPEPGASPTPDDGIWGAVTMQLILSVLLVIGFLSCRLLAPQISTETVSLVQEKTLHDFSFRDVLLERVQEAAGFLESLTPLGSAASEETSRADPPSSSSDSAASDPTASSDAASLTGQPLDFSYESLDGQGGGTLLPEGASLPSDVSFAPVVFSGSLQFPLQGVWRQTSFFGFRENPLDGDAAIELHPAVDLAAAQGEPILAICSGIVTESGQDPWLGNCIRIDHGNGFYSTYGHCSRLIAREGTRVRRGEVIAEVGSSGQSTGPHLHLALEKDGVRFDPAWVFPDQLGHERSALFP